MFAGSITLPVVYPCLMSAESSNILVGRLFNGKADANGETGKPQEVVVC